MKKIKILLTALLMGAAVASCDTPDSYTGVIMRKKYKVGRYRDWYSIVLMTEDGKHSVVVDQITYHKYNIGDKVTLENKTWP